MVDLDQFHFKVKFDSGHIQTWFCDNWLHLLDETLNIGNHQRSRLTFLPKKLKLDFKSIISKFLGLIVIEFPYGLHVGHMVMIKMASMPC